MFLHISFSRREKVAVGFIQCNTRPKEEEIGITLLLEINFGVCWNQDFFFCDLEIAASSQSMTVNLSTHLTEFEKTLVKTSQSLLTENIL